MAPACALPPRHTIAANTAKLPRKRIMKEVPLRSVLRFRGRDGVDVAQFAGQPGQARLDPLRPRLDDHEARRRKRNTERSGTSIMIRFRSEEHTSELQS